MKKIVISLFLVFMALPGVAKPYSTLFTKNATDPIKEFTRWQSFAMKETNTVNYIHMGVLATVNVKGKPMQRTMFISSVTNEGFFFHSPSNSRKILHLKQNKSVSLLFLWEVKNHQFLQVRVKGDVKIEQAKESGTYKNVNTYLIKPKSMQFLLANNSKGQVDLNYLHYTKSTEGTWTMQHSASSLTKTKKNK